MSSAHETRLLEILVTHNEPVSYADLACALGLPNATVQELALRLQVLGHAFVDDVDHTVSATSAADTALREGR